MASDYIKIFVRDYAAQLRVGILPEEKHGPQTVIINIECEAVKAERFDNPAEESLDRAIDYRRVHDFIARDMKAMPHIPLLESAAELIAGFCLTDPRTGAVRVRLEKPGVLPHSAGAGVELYRVRSSA